MKSFLKIATVSLLIPVILFFYRSILPFYGGLFAAEILSASEIQLTLDAYHRFASLMMKQAGSRFGKKGMDGGRFSVLFAHVAAQLNRAEIQACSEMGISQDRYRLVYDRLFMVKMHYHFNALRTKLAEDLSRRKAMTEADLEHEAERSFQEMAAWHKRVGHHETFEDVKRNRDEALQQYLESIERKNDEIDNHNNSLLPNPQLDRIRAEIQRREKQLSDPRFAVHHEKIQIDIDRLEQVAEGLIRKDKRRIKSRKQPDPLILKKINKPLETYHLRQKNAVYDELIRAAQDQKDSGQWGQTVKNNHHKKITTLTASLGKLEKALTDPRLRQAAQDGDLVSRIVDRQHLDALSPLWWQDVPHVP